ncbi:MAG: hypothetical protein K2N64_00720 [Anaeroplasmataceae bacterium]|nr:hypothetical protein [Anaeroplasmataceae bacterium]
MIKKIGMICILCLFFTVIFINKASATETTAMLKEFKVEGLKYVNDKDETSKTIAGEKWEYGNIDMWSAVYKQQIGKSMVYYVLTETLVSSNLNSLKGGYYRMVNDYMNLEIEGYMDDSMDNLRLVRYAPESDFFGENTSSESKSISLGIGVNKSKDINFSVNDIEVSVGTDLDFSFGVIWTTNYSIGNVNYVTKSIDNKLTSKITFAKQADKKLNTSYPYRGNFILHTTAVFELENYTERLEEKLHFKIEYTGAIRKYACVIWGCNGCESLKDTYSRTYDL